MLPAPRKQHLEWIPPKPGCQIQVIGAGLPRTGTNTFCAAVSHLLNGPSYHAGVQTVVTGDPSHTRTWTEILKSRPHATPQARKETLERIRTELDGYILTIDPPLPQLLPELLELYPDAIVIVLLRNKDTWSASAAKAAALFNLELLQFIFFWIRNLREMPKLWHQMGRAFEQVYGYSPKDQDSWLRLWNDHMEWVRELVPEEKLFFYDVKDGWEPLCKILDRPVPKDVPFPRLNDSREFEDAFKSWATQGLTYWAVALGVAVAAGGVAARFYSTWSS